MIIMGWDFHSRMQQIAMLDTETGELIEKPLEHENGEAKSFYEGLIELPASLRIGEGSQKKPSWPRPAGVE